MGNAMTITLLQLSPLPCPREMGHENAVGPHDGHNPQGQAHNISTTTMNGIVQVAHHLYRYGHGPVSTNLHIVMTIWRKGHERKRRHRQHDS